MSSAMFPVSGRLYIYICIGCLRHHYVSFHNESKIKVFAGR